MLQSLHIINFAIIEDTVIDFDQGVTVFTGETGAGKSILIDALAMLTGRRASTDLIRTGADFFKVEGVFYADSSIIEELKEEGIDSDNGQIIISRKLNRSGRGICTINGSFCTVSSCRNWGRNWCVSMSRMITWSFCPFPSVKGWWTPVPLLLQKPISPIAALTRNGRN